MKRTILLAVFLPALAIFDLPAQEKPEPDPPRIMKENLIEMETLVEQGADPNKPIFYSRMRLKGETEPPDSLGSYYPLDAAIDSHQPNLVKRILALGAKPRGNELADAAFTSHGSAAVKIAKMLLDAGVDPNCTEDRFYGPALHAASSRGNLDLVKLLLAQPDIDVDLRDLDGRTALMPATKAAQLKVVEALLEAGADPTIRNERGETADDEALGEIEKLKQVIQKVNEAAQSRKKNAVTSPKLPAGKWIVTFDNGVVETCAIHQNGAAFVSEPLRSSPGKATVENSSIVITCDDDRIESWKPVGDQFVVRHWNPISEKGIATPALGIAERASVVTQ